MNRPHSALGEEGVSRSPEQGEQNGTHRWWFLLFLGMALCLALWAGRWGMAGLYTYPARLILDNWEQTKQPATATHPAIEERWQMALASLAKAQALEPDNAEIPFLIGRLHHHHALLQSPWSTQAKFHWQQTILAYQQALQLRPVWGYGWILLAQARVQAGGSSTEALADWMRAMQLAPRSRDVQLTAIRTGFALWSLLDDAQRKRIHILMEETMPQDGDTILQQAAKYNLLPLARPLLEKNPQWQKRFDSLSQTLR